MKIKNKKIYSTLIGVAGAMMIQPNAYASAKNVNEIQAEMQEETNNFILAEGVLFGATNDTLEERPIVGSVSKKELEKLTKATITLDNNVELLKSLKNVETLKILLNSEIDFSFFKELKYLDNLKTLTINNLNDTDLVLDVENIEDLLACLNLEDLTLSDFDFQKEATEKMLISAKCNVSTDCFSLHQGEERVLEVNSYEKVIIDGQVLLELIKRIDRITTNSTIYLNVNTLITFTGNSVNFLSSDVTTIDILDPNRFEVQLPTLLEEKYGQKVNWYGRYAFFAGPTDLHTSIRLFQKEDGPDYEGDLSILDNQYFKNEVFKSLLLNLLKDVDFNTVMLEIVNQQKCNEEEWGFLKYLNVSKINFYEFPQSIDVDFLNSLSADITWSAYKNIPSSSEFIEDLVKINNLKSLSIDPKYHAAFITKEMINKLKEKGVDLQGVDFWVDALPELENYNRLLDEILQELNLSPELDDQEKINQILLYILKKYSYHPNRKEDENYIAGLGMLTTGSTKILCNNYATLFAALACRSGIDCKIAVGSNHAWNLVNIDGNYSMVDPTWLDNERFIEYIEKEDYEMLKKEHAYYQFLIGDSSYESGHQFENLEYSLGNDYEKILENMEQQKEKYELNKELKKQIAFYLKLFGVLLILKNEKRLRAHFPKLQKHKKNENQNKI